MGKSISLLASRPSRFFNRSNEVKTLVHEVTKCHPGLILVTGPPDSGKTSVLQEVMKESKDKCQWFHIDMRQPGNSWDNIPSMYHNLYRAFAIDRSSRMSSIRALEMTTKILEWFTIKLKLFFNRKSPPPDAEDMKKLLLTIERKISARKRWRKSVVYIDEANHMYGCLDNTTKGQIVLNCSWNLFIEIQNRMGIFM